MNAVTAKVTQVAPPAVLLSVTTHFVKCYYTLCGSFGDCLTSAQNNSDFCG